MKNMLRLAGSSLWLNQPGQRLARHILFWLAFSVYFTIQSYYPSGISGMVDNRFIRSAFLSTCLFVPLCILSAYVFLYYLSPRFLQKNKFRPFIPHFLVLFLIGLSINYFTSIFFFKFSTHSPAGPLRLFLLGLHNTVIAVLWSVFLTGIQLNKVGYLQQKANIELVRQKTKAEMQLLKTRIDPQFLFRSLENLQAKIKKEEPDSPGTILELSDMLSYTLYECEEELVPLEKEIAAIKAFLTLEKTGLGRQYNITTQIRGNLEKKFIVPLTLLSLLQYFFHYVHTTVKEFEGIHLWIEIRDEKKLQFSLRMAKSRSLPSLNGCGDFGEKIGLIRNRLEAMYPKAYRLDWEKSKDNLNLKLEVCL